MQKKHKTPLALMCTLIAILFASLLSAEEQQPPAQDPLTDTDTQIEEEETSTDKEAQEDADTDTEAEEDTETDTETETDKGTVAIEEAPLPEEVKEPVTKPEDENETGILDGGLLADDPEEVILVDDAEEVVKEKYKFPKETWEVGLGAAMAGYGDDFYLGLDAAAGYYVIDGLAPGLEVQYTKVFSDTEYPQSLTLMPFIKYVFPVSDKLAPFAFVGGGKNFEFASDRAVNSWFIAPGIGAHIRLGAKFSLNFRILFEHFWYDNTKIKNYNDNQIVETEGIRFDCGEADCQGDYADGTHLTVQRTQETDAGSYIYSEELLCSNEDATDEDSCEDALMRVDDAKDVTKEWLYPVITIGLSFIF